MTPTPLADAPVSRPVLQVVRQAPRAVLVLTFGAFVSRLGSFFSTFATLFLTEWGLSAQSVAPVLICVGVAGVLGSLVGGWLVDRFGHRATLVVSMSASSAAVALLINADRPTMLVVAVCLISFWTNSYTPAASALLIDNSDPIDRVPIFAFFRMALNLGAALGPLLAGVLASRSYSLLFAVEAVAYALCGLIFLWGLPSRQGAGASGRREERAVQDRPPSPAAGWSHLRVWALCTLLCGVAAIYAQYQSTLPLQLVTNDFTVTFYGALLALNGFLVIGGELPISSLTRRLPWALPLVVGVAAMAAGLVLAASSTAAYVVVAAFVLFTVGEMVFAPVANAAVAELSPAGAAARCQGLLATAQSLGFTLGPAIGISIYALSDVLLWAGVGVTAGALCIGFVALWRVQT